jgi:hypothetical protein
LCSRNIIACDFQFTGKHCSPRRTTPVVFTKHNCL